MLNQRKKVARANISHSLHLCSDPSCFYCRELRKMYMNHVRNAGSGTIVQPLYRQRARKKA